MNDNKKIKKTRGYALIIKYIVAPLVVIIVGGIIVLHYEYFAFPPDTTNGNNPKGQTSEGNSTKTIDNNTIEVTEQTAINDTAKIRIEATGESGYQLNEKSALDAAEEDAKNKLLRRLNKSSIDYSIDNDTVYLVDGYGYKAKKVIFTYK